MNIYVGNLSYNIGESQLEAAFTPKGTVTSVKIITDKYSGQSKGFGFVEMPNDSEANQAIIDLNGQELDGRALTVNQARERTERPRY